MLTPENIDKVLERLKGPVNTYCEIQRLFHADEEEDSFKKAFCTFYRIYGAGRPKSWRDGYFSYMKEVKDQCPSFISALSAISRIPDGKFDFSFTSKLIATINPNLPVIDSMVLKFFQLKLPSSGVDNRLQKAADIYEELHDRYITLIQKPEGIMIIEKFDTKFPSKQITSIKKLDLVLWKMMAMKKNSEL